MALRILVVDDFEPWRRFVSSTFQQQKDLQILFEVSDGLEAVYRGEDLRPDLILLDIGLPRLNGIKAAQRIREVSPNSKILFLSEENSPDIAEAALTQHEPWTQDRCRHSWKVVFELQMRKAGLYGAD